MNKVTQFLYVLAAVWYFYFKFAELPGVLCQCFQQQIRRDFEKPEAPGNNTSSTSAKITNTERRLNSIQIVRWNTYHNCNVHGRFHHSWGLKNDGKAVLDGSAYFKVFYVFQHYIASSFLSAFVIYNELLQESFLAIQPVALVLRCSVGGLVFAFFSGFSAVQDNKGRGSPTENMLWLLFSMLFYAFMFSSWNYNPHLARTKREGKICLQDRKIWRRLCKPEKRKAFLKHNLIYRAAVKKPTELFSLLCFPPSFSFCYFCLCLWVWAAGVESARLSLCMEISVVPRFAR